MFERGEERMDLEYLRLFICLADNLSFTKAARQLYMSQSSLSSKISELEKQIGVVLFERTTRSVSLTPAGQYFLAESKNLIRRFNELTIRTREVSTGNVGSLSVGYLDSIGTDVVEPTIVKHCRKHPSIDLQIRKLSYPQLLKQVGEMDLDIAFIMNNELEGSVPVVSEKVLEARMKILCNKTHPLAERKMLKISELSNEPIIIVENIQSKSLTKMVSKMFARQGLVPNIVRECAGPEELAMYVASGQGIGVVSSFFSVVLSRFEHLCLIPLSHITDTREMCVIYHRENPNNCIAPFLETVRESAREIAAENPEYFLPDEPA